MEADVERVGQGLLTESGQLRRYVRAEFKGIGAVRGRAPNYVEALERYEATLVAATEANKRAIRAIFFGSESTNGGQLPWLRRVRLAASGLFPTVGRRRQREYDSLGSVLRHLAKDWTAEHGGARRVVVDRVVEALRRTGALRVAIPGSGQGRLAHDIAAAVPEAQVVGLERSVAQFHIGRFMLDRAYNSKPHLPGGGGDDNDDDDDDTSANKEEKKKKKKKKKKAIVFHPYLDEPRDCFDDATRAAAFRAPDITTGGGCGGAPLTNLDLRLVDDALDWVVVAANAQGPFDAVVTCFFLDCHPDVVAAITAIHGALKPGGTWIFAGPLHYHHATAAYDDATASPTAHHLATLASDIGFHLRRVAAAASPEKVHGRASPAPPEILQGATGYYPRRPNALWHEAAWHPAFFEATKK